MTTWLEDQLEPFTDTSADIILSYGDARRIGAKLDEVLKEKDAEIAHLREIVAAADRLRFAAFQWWDFEASDDPGWPGLAKKVHETISAYDAIRQPAPESMSNTGESFANTWEITTLRSEIAHLRGMIEGGAEAQRWINQAHESRIEALESRGWADEEQDDDSRG